MYLKTLPLKIQLYQKKKAVGNLIEKELQKINYGSTNDNINIRIDKLLSDYGTRKRIKMLIHIYIFPSWEIMLNNKKSGYHFTINDRSSYFDWFNGVFEVNFNVNKLANGNNYADGDQIALNNNAASIIDRLIFKQNGKKLSLITIIYTR